MEMHAKKLNSTCFYYTVNGQLSSGDFPLRKELYVKLSYEHGPDWQLTAGSEESMTQLSLKSQNDRQLLVWNYPISSTWKASNPHGWPRLVLSVYGPDWLGHDVVCGYGSLLLPVAAGSTTRTVAIYAPAASSTAKHWGGILSGRRPELMDPKTVARNEGRNVTRMATQGYVTLELHTMLKDFRSFGYEYDNGRQSQTGVCSS